MGRVRRKRMHKNDKSIRKKFKTKRIKRFIDQVHEDLVPARAIALLNAKPDVEMPGLGQNICIHCSRHFIDDTALNDHFKSKLHKKRVKRLKEPIYTHKEAESAGGIGQYTKPAPPPKYEPILRPATDKSTVKLNIESMNII